MARSKRRISKVSREAKLLQKAEIFAVASFGGHFEQLLQLAAAWQSRHCHIVTTGCDRSLAVGEMKTHFVIDCHQGQWARAIITSFQLLWLMVRCRPQVLITTGALPGLLAAIIARFLSIPVIWVDSVANAEELSTSGRHALRFADCHLTQWPHLADESKTHYAGSLF